MGRVAAYPQLRSNALFDHPVTGNGGKERITPLHLEIVERLAALLAVAGIADNPAGPLFPAVRSPRGQGRDGFRREPMTRAVEKLIGRYDAALGLDPSVTVHSPGVTALTTARERGIGYHQSAGLRGACRSTNNVNLYPVKGSTQQEPSRHTEILTRPSLQSRQRPIRALHLI